MAGVLVAAAALFAAWPAFAQNTTFELDPARTEIAFTLGATLHTVHGSFQLKSGTITFDPATGKAGGLVVVDATSGASGNADRDQNMHRNVLESMLYPEITFNPVAIDGQLAPQGVSRLQIRGALRIHGEDHDIIVPVIVHAGSESIADFDLTVPYVRWGMKSPNTLFLRVSDAVEIKVHAVGRLKLPIDPGAPQLQPSELPDAGRNN